MDVFECRSHHHASDRSALQMQHPTNQSSKAMLWRIWYIFGSALFLFYLTLSISFHRPTIFAILMLLLVSYIIFALRVDPVIRQNQLPIADIIHLVASYTLFITVVKSERISEHDSCIALIQGLKSYNCLSFDWIISTANLAVSYSMLNIKSSIVFFDYLPIAIFVILSLLIALAIINNIMSSVLIYELIRCSNTENKHSLLTNRVNTCLGIFVSQHGLSILAKIEVFGLAKHQRWRYVALTLVALGLVSILRSPILFEASMRYQQKSMSSMAITAITVDCTCLVCELFTFLAITHWSFYRTQRKTTNVMSLYLPQ
ncbi:hypothetical protein ACOME3_009338 [Neoechinorhynchus agilis]